MACARRAVIFATVAGTWAVTLQICAAATLALQQVATGLSAPIGIVNAHDGSNRLFVVEQGGTIRIIKGTQVLTTPFLDIHTRLLSGGERGLLGLAFDPSYASNGLFYVYYTSAPSGTVTIARYSVTTNPDVANPNSEVILKTQAHSDFSNHNGGSLVFGPDGCLYAGIGDGGSGGDPQGNGQNLSTLLGKIIRINASDGAPCSAAPGNPFVGTSGARGEIWALGVRNPWRITFDRSSGDLFIADVGQGAVEEVNIQPPGSAGRNYCWRRKEGSTIFDPNTPCTSGTPTDPVIEYTHAAGRCSITGGYRYRGIRFNGFAGLYFYGDYCTGEVWGATQSGSTWTSTLLLATTYNITSFGEDEAGELYLADGSGGRIYQLIASNSCPITVGATDTAPGQSPRNSGLLTTICQTNPSSGTCINPATPGASATLNIGQNETATFSTFVKGQGTFVPYDPVNNRIYIIARQGSDIVGVSSVAVRMLSADRARSDTAAAGATSIYSAVLPNARTTTPGTAVTAFATIVNAGSVAATACAIALPGGIPASFTYQTTNPSTNTPTGTANTPANIAAGGNQSYYFAINPSSAFSQTIAALFTCTNTDPAPRFEGVNTFLLTSTTSAVADVVSISATQSGDGNMSIPGPSGTGVIGTAVINLRACP